MDPSAAARTYALAFKSLKAEWYYGEPRFSAGSASLERARAARAVLAQLDPDAIDAWDQRHALWINVYNGAVVDQAIDMGVRQSVKEVRGFFRRRFLEVAGTSLSLDDIEHGLLRDNRRHPARLLPALTFRPRLERWIARPFDPRIHFALNCGAQSCPPLAAYGADGIDAELDAAAAAFINAEVEVDAEEKKIRANPILKWYRADFGDLEAWIRRYRDGGLPEGKWRFVWKDYDWSL